MIYKPAYDVNFIIVKFLEDWNIKEKYCQLSFTPWQKKLFKKMPVERRRRLSRCHGRKILWISTNRGPSQ